MTKRYPHALSPGEFLAIAGGGVCGALARHVTSSLMGNLTFPWATWSENVLGTFLMGLAVGFVLPIWKHRLAAPFLLVGVLGSFTTFSTLALDYWTIADNRSYVAANGYLLLTMVAGFLAVVVGHRIGDSLKGKQA